MRVRPLNTRYVVDVFVAKGGHQRIERIERRADADAQHGSSRTRWTSVEAASVEPIKNLRVTDMACPSLIARLARWTTNGVGVPVMRRSLPHSGS